MPPPSVNAFPRQGARKHARPHERMLKMHLVNPAHQCKIGSTNRSGQVVHRTAADVQ